jgi:hypothetical protein
VAWSKARIVLFYFVCIGTDYTFLCRMNSDMSSAEDEAQKRLKYRSNHKAKAASAQTKLTGEDAASPASPESDLSNGMASVKRRKTQHMPMIRTVPPVLPNAGTASLSSAQQGVRMCTIAEMIGELNTRDVSASGKKDANSRSSEDTRVKLEGGQHATSSLESSTDAHRKRQSLFDQGQAVKQDADIEPWDEAAYRQTCSMLPPCNYYVESDLTNSISPAKFQQLLRERRVLLPIMHADHDSAIMKQAGTWRLDQGHGDSRAYTFPACSRGDACVGVEYALPGLPREARQAVRWMGFMYEEEYASFLVNGIAPQSPRPCILCCRKGWTLHCLIVRHELMMGAAGSVKKHETRPYEKRYVKLVQPFANLIDQPRGYHRSRVLTPTMEDPVIQPCVLPNLQSLRCRQEESGRWTIDQSALVFSRKPPEPKIGESIKDF